MMGVMKAADVCEVKVEKKRVVKWRRMEEEEEEKERLRQNKDGGGRRSKAGKREKGGIYLERLRRVGS